MNRSCTNTYPHARHLRHFGLDSRWWWYCCRNFVDLERNSLPNHLIFPINSPENPYITLQRTLKFSQIVTNRLDDVQTCQQWLEVWHHEPGLQSYPAPFDSVLVRLEAPSVQKMVTKHDSVYVNDLVIEFPFCRILVPVMKRLVQGSRAPVACRTLPLSRQPKPDVTNTSNE